MKIKEYYFSAVLYIISLLCFQIYKGYVDDPRNTDNSWMETVVYNFHDETGEFVGRLHLSAGVWL